MLKIKSAIRRFGLLALFSISICIGVASVLTINSISNYCIESAKLMLDRMGIDGYVIKTKSICDEDILALNQCKYVKYVTPITTALSQNVHLDEMQCVGGNSQISEIYSLNIEKGRFYSNKDLYDNNAVCVIGSNTAHSMFKTSNCIGQKISINIKAYSQSVKIVGVYSSDKISTASGLGLSEPIYFPYTFLSAINKQTNNSLMIKTSSDYDVSLCTKGIVEHCDSIFGHSNYKLTNTASEREKIDSMMQLIKYILEIIVSISILVSIMGLMVIMIINIKYKRKEIGLKKALGASDFSIIKEVSYESVIIATIGTINGFLLYKVIALLFNNLNLVDFKILISVPILTILSALTIGIIPSIIAAKTKPSIALKSEN